MVLLGEEAWRLLSLVLDNRLPTMKVLVPEESSTDSCLGIEFAVPGVMQSEKMSCLLPRASWRIRPTGSLGSNVIS